ncbi:hypothetical protein LZ31DRAFT_224069 [Colletotrichum somersetense]|nr:hypothetical protein LZ31DRAFT_224069 [Colletotrichum somersetense]
MHAYSSYDQTGWECFGEGLYTFYLYLFRAVPSLVHWMRRDGEGREPALFPCTYRTIATSYELAPRRLRSYNALVSKSTLNLFLFLLSKPATCHIPFLEPRQPYKEPGRSRLDCRPPGWSGRNPGPPQGPPPPPTKICTSRCHSQAHQDIHFSRSLSHARISI